MRLKRSQGTSSIFKNFSFVCGHRNIFENLHSLKPLTSFYFHRIIALPPTGKMLNHIRANFPVDGTPFYGENRSTTVCFALRFRGLSPRTPRRYKEDVFIILLLLFLRLFGLHNRLAGLMIADMLSAILAGAFLYCMHSPYFHLYLLTSLYIYSKKTLLLFRLMPMNALFPFLFLLGSHYIFLGSASFPFEFFHIFVLLPFRFPLSYYLSFPRWSRSLPRCSFSTRSISSLDSFEARSAASVARRCSSGLYSLSIPRISCSFS